MAEEIIKVPFHVSDKQYSDYAEEGINFAISEGRLTPEDANLIKQFVRQKSRENRMSVSRKFTIINELSNLSRYFSPLISDDIEDVYDGMEALEQATVFKRIKTQVVDDDTGETAIKWILKDTGRPMKPNTISAYQKAAKRFYLWLIDEDKIELSEKQKAKFRTKIQNLKVISPDTITKSSEDLLSDQDIQQMLKVCTSSRDRAIIITAFEACLRIGEIGAMEWQDLDFTDKNFCLITTDFKTGKMRHIPVHAARPYLLQWKNDYPTEVKPDSPVFVSRYKKSLNYHALRKQLTHIAKRAGIDHHITMHIFRHSGITSKIKAGWHETAVKMIAWGGVESKQFETYCHLSRHDIVNEARKQNGITAPPEEAQEDVLKPRQCTRCLTLNNPSDNFCGCCGAPLTVEIAADLESMKQEIHADPAFQQLKQRAEEQLKLFS